MALNRDDRVFSLQFAIVEFSYYTHLLFLTWFNTREERLLYREHCQNVKKVSPFPAGDHKATIHRRAQKHNKHIT